MKFSDKLELFIQKNLTSFSPSYHFHNDSLNIQIPKHEFINFLGDINNEFNQYEERLKNCKTELEKSNLHLIESNQNMSLVLNSVDEGLFLIDSNGYCSRVCSKAAIEHFETDFTKNKTLFKNLFDLELAKDIQEWLDLSFSQKFNFEQIKNLGPNHFTTQSNQIIEINYSAVLNESNKLKHILVVSKNMTSELMAKKEVEVQKNKLETILEICQSPKHFRDMLDAIHNLNSEIKTILVLSNNNLESKQVKEFKRLLHTIKGSISSFNLNQQYDKLHQFENDFEALHETQDQLALAYDITDYLDRFLSDIHTEYDFLIDRLIDHSEIQTYDNNSYKYSFLNKLEKQNLYELAHEFKQSFILIEFSKVFLGYNKVIKQTSELLGKKVSPIKFKGDEVYIYEKAYQDFITSCVHLFRNICDHGIETEIERLHKGKSASGQVSVTVEKNGDRIKLTISDDGRGLNLEKIKNKIKGTPLESVYKTDKELMMCIFEPEFSTKDEVTTISGRGVGLDAVSNEVRKLKGQIDVFSQPEKGTSFIFDLPLINDPKLVPQSAVEFLKVV